MVMQYYDVVSTTTTLFYTKSDIFYFEGNMNFSKRFYAWLS